MSIRVEIRPAREAIARHSGVVHVAVRVSPEGAPARPPVALALVVDSSGSMAERAGHGEEGRGAPAKIRFVKESAHFLVDLLRPQDRLAVVSFADGAWTVLPSMMVGDGGRQEIHGAIERLRPGGGTNMEAGLRLGGDLLVATGELSRRLILLSDGEANKGESRIPALARIVAEASGTGITTSTVGVGLEFNSALLMALADAGGGDMHHVEDPRSSEAALTAELFAAGELTAREVLAELVVAVPATIAAGNLNDYPEEPVRGGLRVRLGDLARPRDIVFEVTTPVAVHGTALELVARAFGTDVEGGEVSAAGRATVRLVSADEVGVAGEDPEVAALAMRLLQARAETQVALLMEAGQVPAALRRVGLAHRDITIVSRLYSRLGGSAAAADAELSDLAGRIRSGGFDRRGSKDLYMRAQAGRRSRLPHLPVPFDRSYWVAPRLLAGCYPGSTDRVRAEEKISALHRAGVRRVISLMEPKERLRPYAKRFLSLGGEIVNHPIVDQQIPTRGLMTTILDEIDRAGEGIVFVHCWGGRGRTGTVVGCWLIRHGLARPDRVVGAIGELRANCPDVMIASPSTIEQIQFVQSWRLGQ